MRLAVLLTLRGGLEAGVVVGLGYWGYHDGGTAAARILLAVAAPAVGFGVWGAVDFRWAGRAAEPLRLLEELVISGLAALALYASGQPTAGAALVGLSLVYHGVVYTSGNRLLSSRRPRGPGSASDERRLAAGISIEQDPDAGVATITCTRRITSRSRAPLTAAVRECLAEAPEAIRFDLREAWIDSGGIALVLALYGECLNAGTLVEALTAPAAREIFSRLGLPLRFRVDKDGQWVRVIRTARGGM